MKRFIAVVAAVLVAVGVQAQSNTASRPVSAAVTNTINSLAGVPAVGETPGVGQSAGQFVNSLYIYCATNGTVSAGLGNTLDKLVDKSAHRVSLKALTTENINLPLAIPTNGFVNANVDLVSSQLYAADKTHLGLGLGLDELWHVGWLKKAINFGPFQNLQGIHLAEFCSPDVDKTVNLQFARRYTVVGFEAGLRFTF